jgi:hypothetical protein
MKTYQIGYWVGVFVSAMIFCGCDPGSPTGRPVLKRHFDGIEIGSIGPASESGLWQSLPGGSFPDGGDTCRPRLGYWARPLYYGGEGNDIGGIKIAVNTQECLPWTNAPRGISPVKPNCTPECVRTQATGYAAFYISSDTSAFYDWSYTERFYVTAVLKDGIMDEAEGYFGKRGYRSHYKCYSPSTDEYGEYWCSASHGGVGRRDISIVSPSAVGRPTCSTSVPMTQEELDYLSSEPNAMPTNLVVKVFGSTWLMSVSGESGNRMKEIAGSPVILEDADEETIRDYSTPYCLSYQFQTAETTNLMGSEFTARLKVSDANGITVSYPIPLYVISSAGAKHTARTGLFLPCEPNGISCPSVIGGILAISVRENDVISVSIENMAQFLPFVSDKWLTSYGPMDTNRDGIVNLRDLK